MYTSKKSISCLTLVQPYPQPGGAAQQGWQQGPAAGYQQVHLVDSYYCAVPLLDIGILRVAPAVYGSALLTGTFC